jgi:hypothetical protein
MGVAPGHPAGEVGDGFPTAVCSSRPCDPSCSGALGAILCHGVVVVNRRFHIWAGRPRKYAIIKGFFYSFSVAGVD